MDTGTKQRRSRNPVSLGFFLQPHISDYNLNKRAPLAKFLHCSDDGKGLQDGEWGSFDASLSFLDMPMKHIMGSSNGLLLCSPDFFKQNSQYIVCNPVTREFKVIPPPHKAYLYVAVTFICKRNDDRASLDKIHYEILRVGVVIGPCTLSTTYEMETFSSLNGEWRRSHFVSSLPFALAVANTPGVVLDDVIYWRGFGEYLAVHDRSKSKDEENIQLLKLPMADETITGCSQLSLCEGKMYYARNDSSHIELWVLSGNNTGSVEWVLKYKVSLTEIRKNNPNTRIPKWSLISVRELHPGNSQLILVQTFYKYYWYDFENGKLHEIASKDMLYDFFLYEWPCAPKFVDDSPKFVDDSQWLSRL